MAKQNLRSKASVKRSLKRTTRMPLLNKTEHANALYFMVMLENQYKKEHDPTAFKEGDTVKVLRRFKPNEGGCDVQWADGSYKKDMDRSIGREFTVDCVEDGSFRLSNDRWYPSMVLKKVHIRKKK